MRGIVLRPEAPVRRGPLRGQLKLSLEEPQATPSSVVSPSCSRRLWSKGGAAGQDRARGPRARDQGSEAIRRRRRAEAGYRSALPSPWAGSARRRGLCPRWRADWSIAFSPSSCSKVSPRLRINSARPSGMARWNGGLSSARCLAASKTRWISEASTGDGRYSL